MPSDLVYIVAWILGGVCLAFYVLISVPLYLGRKYKIVKTRGLYHLQFVGYTAMFVAAYTAITAATFYFEAPFYVSWLFISLRRWALVFALVSLLSFQIILASIHVPTRVVVFAKCLWRPLQATDARQLDQILRKSVFVAIFGYMPLFVVSMVLPAFQVAETAYTAVYFIAFGFFVIAVVAAHVFVALSWHINQYYSHRWTYILILVVTDCLVFGWIPILIVNSTELGQLDPNSLIYESIFDTIVTMVWYVLYATQPVLYLFLAGLGYPKYRDQYETAPSIRLSSEKRSHPLSGKTTPLTGANKYVLKASGDYLATLHEFATTEFGEVPARVREELYVDAINTLTLSGKTLLKM